MTSRAALESNLTEAAAAPVAETGTTVAEAALPAERSAPSEVSVSPKLGVQVAHGSLWSLLGQVLPLLASLLATPLVIRLLGAEAYGVLSLINLLIGYLAFSDLGMGTASTRFGAEAHAQQDDAAEARVVWTALLLSLVPALTLAGALAVFAQPLLERALRLPPHLQFAGVWTLRLAALGFVGRCLAAVLNTPQLVRLQIRLNATLTASFGVGQIALVPLVLWLGGGLIGAGVVLAATGLLLALSHALCSARLLPALRQPRLDRALLPSLLRFGGALVLSQLANLLLANGEKLVLTRVASVKVLAYYSVAFTLASLLTVAPTALGQALLPAFTRLLARQAHDELQQLYQRALRATLLLAPPIVLVMASTAQPFITLWAGAEFGRESIGPFYVLLAGLIVNILAYVPFNLVIAAGQTHLLARYYWLELLPYLLTAGLLAQRFGALGAALAWSLRTLVDALLYLQAGRRILAGANAASSVSSSSVGPWRSYAVAFAVLFAPFVSLKLCGAALGWQWLGSLLALAAYVGWVSRHLLQSSERDWLRQIVQNRLGHRWRERAE